ncbi:MULTISPECIES: DUF4143 domain-containing protein [Synechococcales]|uniref:DUF4143 domain-containing protein n=1 Tax=unclassified Synechococcus TaxID=2626047 RepID=UPI0021A63FD1|nr:MULTISPECIES: DUF4143 domain-containing protein [unclassified Synechococcus]MCT0212076.1 DUF4143 domain-containing protein [Synechococcus sp. CS-1326]MCT0234197.1 DUF4143 domain-containing protein [Synechococcus sp. CS-1327]
MQAEALVRDLGGFARFLKTISFSHGSTLSFFEVARECQVGRKSVEISLLILEDLLTAFRVPVFSRHAQRQLVALLDQGLEPLRIDGILCLPCGDFLQKLEPETPLPIS